MKKDKIRLGYAPTRRSIFSAPDALRYRGLTRDRLLELGVDIVDIDGINSEGLLFDDRDLPRIVELFRNEGVDGLFFPHCNFGTEYMVASLAREMSLPVLLWGPRDERPDENGIRLRDSQCGLFASGKVLRRFRVPFTYMTNCRLSDPEFERGIDLFQRVCNVVKTFRHIRILQISTRPYDFLTTMCNEGELLEKFNIQLAPVPMTELVQAIEKAKDTTETKEASQFIKDSMEIKTEAALVEKVASLKVAMKKLAEQYNCNAIAIQCWNALQAEIGIMPCAANSLLTGEGIPVVCETDIHGAVTSLMTQAAALGEKDIMFADWTIRHPDNENGELLQHCGPWPLALAKSKPALSKPLVFDYGGAVAAEARHGLLTLVRFDGDNGEYSLLLGNARGIDGPYTLGTYLWIEVENWKRLEAKIVEGPYIHHCVGIHGDYVPVLYEACKYLGLQADLYDDNEETVKAFIRGE
ncbi:MAG: L-fucose/L-arabinose isomerase family protein [Treponema sp.]|jgi:L-fucose isomerase-like protein|nr:L-fucose/L-arabinose isomerase family protein [Treponema sp.]